MYILLIQCKSKIIKVNQNLNTKYYGNYINSLKNNHGQIVLQPMSCVWQENNSMQ